MMIDITPSTVGLAITILGTIIGFIVQYTNSKNKIEENEKAIRAIGAKLDAQEKRVYSVETNGSPLSQDLKTKVEKLEDFNRDTEQSIVKLETKIDTIESKLTDLCLDVKQILKQIIVK
jgi:predicted  nucleic acid-binding Zn-ribbon protein